MATSATSGYEASGLLPGTLSMKSRKVRRGQTSFGGLVSEAEATGEDICTMQNLSPVEFPTLSVREPRRLYLAAQNAGMPHGVTEHCGQVIFAQGTKLYVSSFPQEVTEVTTVSVSDSDKMFASFGEDLIVLPDKLRYNHATEQWNALELDSGWLTNVQVLGNRLTATGYNFLSTGFRAGNVITLETQASAQALAKEYKLRSVGGSYVTIAGTFPLEGTYTLRVRRTFPTLSGLFALGDRLYGYSGQTIRACEAGNFFNWSVVDPDCPAMAPVTLYMRDGGAFTAGLSWQGYPWFFKADRLCRMIGVGDGSGVLPPTPTLSVLTAPGVGLGRGATLCELGGALYYCADSGVYCFSGTFPQHIGGAWSDSIYGSCGGTDGRAYFLAATGADGIWRIYLYHPTEDHGEGAWYVQDMAHPVGMLHAPLREEDGKAGLLQMSDGSLWMTRSFYPAFQEGVLEGQSPGDASGGTSASTPMMGLAEFGDERACEPDGLRLLQVVLRAKGATGASMVVRVRYDDETEWQVLGVLSGSGRSCMYRLPVASRPCEWFRLRLQFFGTWKVSGLWKDMELIR